MKRLLLILNFTFLILSLCYSQGNLSPGTYTSTNKKAIKHFEEGRKYYEARKDAEAEKHLLKAIEKDKNFVEPHVAIAYLYMEQNKKKEGIYHFQQAVNINAKYFPRCVYDLAVAQLLCGLYEDAEKNLENYFEFFFT